MPELTINTTDLDIRRSREELAGLMGSIDAKRPDAWCQYGYPLLLDFDRLLQAYERGGSGFGAVHRILDKCWQERPRIKRMDAQEGPEPVTNAKPPQPPKAPKAKAGKPAKAKGDDEPTPWEKKVNKVLRSINAWQKLRDFDRRNMVGRFAALIYRVADGKQLREPLQRAVKLVDIVPLYEHQIQVTDWFTDQTDADNFGQPKMFRYRMHLPSSTMTAGQPDTWVEVHPSRVQILAEGSVGDMFEGVPLLRAGYNQLVDLEKISGGSAESYLKNSARTVVVKFDKDASPQVITQNTDGSTSGKTVKQVIEENVRRLNRNIDSSMVMQGGEATTLQTQQSPPTSAFEVAANLFAASVRIPFTILFGQQTGRLASNEDQKDMNARCEARQDNDLTPMLEQFVQRMQACGVIDAGEFEIEWLPLDAPGDDAKYGQLGKLTAAMQQAQSAGLTDPLFDSNELRGVAGFDARDDDGMPDEGELAAEEEAARAHELALRGLAPGQQPPAPGGARPRIAAV